MKVTLTALALSSSFAFAQGPLNPPAAPAPSMKSLDQIEARTPIPPSPATPVAGPHFSITQPGSYYLTGNITVSTGDGIRITAASDVTIDLNGFTIKSTLTDTFNGRGISMPGIFYRLTVRNGSIVSSSTPSSPQGFIDGIYSTGLLQGALISGVKVSGVARYGIFIDGQGIVENCIATQNGATGIVSNNGVAVHCVAGGNGAPQIQTPQRIDCYPATE
jgi:hypothetical protein